MLLTAKSAVSWSMPTLTQPFVSTDVVDAVRDGLSELTIDEVVNLDALRLPFGVPFPTAVLVVSDQFFLLRVD